jgi:hypothetical protein
VYTVRATGGIWEPEAAEQPHLEFESWETAALKGHGFIRAARTRKIGGLEPLRDGLCRLQTIPRVLKHISFLANFSGTDKSVPLYVGEQGREDGFTFRR